MLFGKKTIILKFNTINKALSTTKHLQIVNLKTSVIVILDANNNTFVVHIIIQEQEEIAMDPVKKD